MPLERAAATAVRLLDLGYFRIGSDAYADANGSFGLTTLERRHVRRSTATSSSASSASPASSTAIEINDPARHRRAGPHAAAPRRVDPAARLPGRARWARPRRVGASTPTSRELVRGPHGQGLPHLARHRARSGGLAESPRRATPRPRASGRSRRRSRRSRRYLGNTPTMARTSYIDPRVSTSTSRG